MEPEPGEGLDTFLRRAAQVAAFGAAVGAAVGAARAARSDQSEVVAERPSSEPRDGDSEQEPEERPEARQPAPAEEEERAQGSTHEAEAPETEPQDDEPKAKERPQQSAGEVVEPDEEREAHEAGMEPRRESPDGQVGGEAAGVIRRALPQLEQLTGRAPEGVLGVRRDDEGWRLTVEVVELPRVPSSTDVLATYDVVLDGDGDVREYHRSGRYIRGRGDAREQ